MADDSQAALPEWLKKGVVYRIPHMEQASVRKNLTYKTIEDTELKLDVYYPAHHQKGTRLPAVIFVHGDGPQEMLKHIKDSGQYVGWGQLIAASGLIAVTFNHRSTEGLSNVVGAMNDVDDLILYVRDDSASLDIDPERLAIWSCSAGGFFGLRVALYETPPFVRCSVCYYGLSELKAYYMSFYGSDEERTEQEVPAFNEEDFEEFSAIELLRRRPGEVAPMFIARAGLDYAALNEALDRFVATAIEQNVALDFMNHPTGQHAFDVRDDDARSREIIKASLEFIKTHLRE